MKPSRTSPKPTNFFRGREDFKSTTPAIHVGSLEYSSHSLAPTWKGGDSGARRPLDGTPALTLILRSSRSLFIDSDPPTGWSALERCAVPQCLGLAGDTFCVEGSVGVWGLLRRSGWLPSTWCPILRAPAISLDYFSHSFVGLGCLG